MNSNIKEIIELIQKAPLDQTIKNILIRDLQTEGLTEFLKQQIKAYCIDAQKEIEEEYQKAVALLNSSKSTSA